MKGKFLFLGSGASTGIPLISCDCPVCTSNDPHNKRLRPSILLSIEDKKILIDPSPDLRTQALKFGIKHLDGVIITHTHYDHIGGIDELRVFFIRSGRPLPVLLSETSLQELKKRYYYLFEEKSSERSLTAQLNFIPLNDKSGKIDFQQIPLSYFTYYQGGMQVTGFRFGDIAYVSDIYKYDESIFNELKNVKNLIVSAIGYKPSLVHLTLDQAIEFAKKVGAEKTWLNHMSHQVDHEKANAELPDTINLSFDGLELEFEI